MPYKIVRQVAMCDRDKIKCHIEVDGNVLDISLVEALDTREKEGYSLHKVYTKSVSFGDKGMVAEVYVFHKPVQSVQPVKSVKKEQKKSVPPVYVRAPKKEDGKGKK